MRRSRTGAGSAGDRATRESERAAARTGRSRARRERGATEERPVSGCGQDAGRARRAATTEDRGIGRALVRLVRCRGHPGPVPRRGDAQRRSVERARTGCCRYRLTRSRPHGCETAGETRSLVVDCRQVNSGRNRLVRIVTRNDSVTIGVDEMTCIEGGEPVVFDGGRRCDDRLTSSTR